MNTVYTSYVWESENIYSAGKCRESHCVTGGRCVFTCTHSMCPSDKMCAINKWTRINRQRNCLPSHPPVEKKKKQDRFKVSGVSVYHIITAWLHLVDIRSTSMTICA